MGMMGMKEGRMGMMGMMEGRMEMLKLDLHSMTNLLVHRCTEYDFQVLSILSQNMMQMLDLLQFLGMEAMLG